MTQCGNVRRGRRLAKNRNDFNPYTEGTPMAATSNSRTVDSAFWTVGNVHYDLCAHVWLDAAGDFRWEVLRTSTLTATWVQLGTHVAMDCDDCMGGTCVSFHSAHEWCKLALKHVRTLDGVL